MCIVDRATVLTEADGDSVALLCSAALTREDDPLTRYRHLVDESLLCEGIDDAIERREVHATISLSDERLLQLWEGDTRWCAEHFDEATAGKSDTWVGHKVL
jgi:hypothetical protein